MIEQVETVTISLSRYHRLQELEDRINALDSFGKDAEFYFLRVETHPHSWITGYAKMDILPLIDANNKAIEKWRAEMREAPKPKPSLFQRLFRCK